MGADQDADLRGIAESNEWKLYRTYDLRCLMTRVTNPGERNGSKHEMRLIDPAVLQVRHLARECVYRDVDSVLHDSNNNVVFR